MTGLRSTTGLAALLSFELGAVGLLHRLGRLPWLAVDWADLSGWLATTAPEDVVVGLARVVALAAAYWLLASTILYALARASRIPAAVRAVEWWTLPAVRRVADHAIALTLAGSIVSSGAAAASPRSGGPVGRPPVVATELLPPGLDPPRYRPQPAGLAGLEDQGPPPTTTTRRRPGYVPRPAGEGGERVGPTTRAPAASHRVAPGDNLWTIARDHLARVRRRAAGDLSNREIARYWLRVVDANRGSVRSGDPDLIYPGEVIELPPVTPRPR